jgi:hypothetical protein
MKKRRRKIDATIEKVILNNNSNISNKKW